RSVGAPPEVSEAALFTDALIRLRRRDGDYRVEAKEINLAEDTLFNTSFLLPANLIEGIYEVRIFLTRGRQVVDSHTTILNVEKVGLERFLFNLAHDRPMVYGLLALVIAVAAGWGASTVFRLLRS
ncbi:MAG: TIGR02186 family protein, partial [Paracoccaceae bacterium]|nr:TIGR02186 family protein [Paracoccaceae bacterium]